MSSPPIKLTQGAAKDDVVPVNADRPRPVKAPTEGNIVLKAEKGETQEVPHQLPTDLLEPYRGILVVDHRAQGTDSSPCQAMRNPRGIPKDRFEQRLRHLERKMIGGGLIVPRNKNLARPGVKVPELPRFGFTAKKPRKRGKLVVERLVEGS